MAKKRVLHLIFAITFALFSALASTVHAQACSDISGFIDGNITIALKGDCIIDNPVTIAGNVIIKSSGSKPYILTRGVTGNLLTVAEGAALTLENIIIDGGSKQGKFSNALNKSSASLVFVENGAALIMNDGAILQNNTAHTGGGVFVGNGSKFTMNGGKITGNTSDIGGGVFMRHGGVFDMNGGAIVNNTANDFGGGVFVNDAGRFTMSGGEINNNTANGVGGGVNVWGGEFTIIGGAICNNTAVDGNGVFVYDGATFNDKSSLICDSINSNELITANQDSSANIAAKDDNLKNNVTPVNLLLSGLTAGPNPVAKSAGSVTFFHQGSQIRSSSLKIYDASGKFVTNVRINDKAVGNDNAKRAVGSWNLKDKKGRFVSEGTYLVKGNFTTKDGKRERFTLVLGIR